MAIAVWIVWMFFSERILECWNWFPNIFETNLKNWETHTIHSHQRTVAQEGKRIPAINPSTPRAHSCWKFPGNPKLRSDLGRRTLRGHKRSANLETAAVGVQWLCFFNQNPYGAEKNHRKFHSNFVTGLRCPKTFMQTLRLLKCCSRRTLTKARAPQDSLRKIQDTEA